MLTHIWEFYDLSCANIWKLISESMWLTFHVHFIRASSSLANLANTQTDKAREIIQFVAPLGPGGQITLRDRLNNFKKPLGLHETNSDNV